MSTTSEAVQTNLKERSSWLEFEFGIAVRNVRAILREHPAARDNDNLLISLYWTHFDGLHVPVESIRKATSAELIRRARQHIQNKLGELGPSMKVRAARSRAERGFRVKFGNKKPQDTTLETAKT
jgi:hypothetical protein